MVEIARAYEFISVLPEFKFIIVKVQYKSQMPHLRTDRTE